MTPHETAVQVWQVLIAAAHHHQTITADDLGALIGVSGNDLGPSLRCLTRCCVTSDWPLITALVQSTPPGNPGADPKGSQDTDAGRQRVYGHNWFRMRPVTVAALEEAARPAKQPCPKCGGECYAGATLCGFCWTRLTKSAGR